MNNANAITDIAGIRVGHAQNFEALTGCTVILCPEGTVGGVDQRGGGPGTRETDLLRPMHLVEHINAIVLAGGSAFGLDAATGVVRYLEEQGIGFNVGVAKVPIVPSAILFDLGIGSAEVRPDAEMGYQACLNASDTPPEQGNVGAGTGATVGKVLGMQNSMKAGVGTASIHVGGGLIVGAIVAVNAIGDVVHPSTNEIIAGARVPQPDSDPNKPPFHMADTLKVFATLSESRSTKSVPQSNTVIGVVATNAKLTKEHTNKIAQMAQDGLARTIRPAHTMSDGDTIFSLATGAVEGDVNIVGSFAAEVFAQAILQAVYAAKPAGGIPAAGQGEAHD